MNGVDPNLITIAVFAAGYFLSRWDKRGDQGTTASVAIAELRTELANLRRDVERFLDRFEFEPAPPRPRSFGRRGG